MTSSIETLCENSSGSLVLQTTSSRGQVLLVEHQYCQAEISLYGGQLLTWQPTGHAPVIWMSRQANFVEGGAIRGGIPLCWPWFGANEHRENELGANKSTANHGFARNKVWQFSDVEITKQDVQITLKLTGENQHELWPHKFELTQVFTLGKTLKQQLETSNLSSKEVQHNFALHTYFSVGDINKVNVEELNGKFFDDKVTGDKQQIDSLSHYLGPLDRIYDHKGEVVLKDDSLGRNIHIRSNCEQVVMWNAGEGAVKKMVDMHANAEQEYLCLEVANTKWQQLAAQATHTVWQEILLS